MAGKRPEAPKFNTPKVTFKFPRLGVADTKFKAEGEYSVKVVGPKAAFAALIAKLEPLHKEAVKRGKAAYAALPVATRKKLDAKGGFTINPLFNLVYDDDEKETGEIEMNIKMVASGTYKSGPKQGKTWTRKPSVYDSKMKPMDGSKVWGGSKGYVSFEVGIDKDGQPGYFIPGTGAAGLSLKLQAVQVIELVQGGSRSASDYGFAEEEGHEDDGKSVEKNETAGEDVDTPAEKAGDSAPDEVDF